MFRTQLPNARVVGDTLSSVRRSTTVALAGLELPRAFQVATVNAAINASERNTKSAKASRRRLVEKATKLAGVRS